MGIFDMIFQVNPARIEKRAAMLRSQGKCPDCYKRGIYSLINESISPLECPNCHGTGLLFFAELYKPTD